MNENTDIDLITLSETFNVSDLEIIRNALLKYYDCYIGDAIEGKSLTIETTKSLAKNHDKILHLIQLFDSAVCLLKDDKN